MRRPAKALLPFLPAAAVALAIVGAVVGGGPRAQTPPGQTPGQPGAPGPGKGPLVIDVTGPRRDLFKIAVPRLIGDADTGSSVAEIVSGDLYSSGWFKVLDPRSFLAKLDAEGTGIAVQDWRNIGAEGVAKGRATIYNDQLSLEFKLYELGRGPYPVLEKSYKGPVSQARFFAHSWAADIVRHFTGEDSFFNTQIAFSGTSGPGQKDVYVMDYDGHGVRKLTNNGSQNILPAWMPGGGGVAFTSFLRGNPDLYTVGMSGGRAKRVASYPGVNMGAAFSPDGSKIALTLSQDGNPEIYLIAASDGKILKRLTDSPFIDSSPAWSPDGGRLAFVSNRHGNPQIWTMSEGGGGQSKLTRRGNYNQEPQWCPKCQVPTIAFTARDERSNFDIFTIAVESGELVRITENQGSNEHPTWAPNGRAMAFSSPSRGGVWVSTADGKLQRQVAEAGTGGLSAVHDEARIVRLGEGVDRSGVLKPEAIERALAALQHCADKACALGVDRVAAVGTQALREVSNGRDFLDKARAILGADIEVIEGDREARLSWRAASDAFPLATGARRTVLDIGGGSTEILVGSAAPEQLISLPIGSVRLTERLLKNDPPTDEEKRTLVDTIDAALAAAPAPEGELVGIAGTVTTLCAIHLGLRDYDGARVHGTRIARADVERVVEQLGRTPVSERRRTPGLDPLRADVIYAGGMILARVMARAGAAEVIVSDRGIRWGLAAEVAAKLA